MIKSEQVSNSLTFYYMFHITHLSFWCCTCECVFLFFVVVVFSLCMFVRYHDSVEFIVTVVIHQAKM